MQGIWKDRGFWILGGKTSLKGVQGLKGKEEGSMPSTNGTTSNMCQVRLLDWWPSAKWKCEVPCSESRKEGGKALASLPEPHTGLKLTDCEVMTWAKVGRLTGAPWPFLTAQVTHGLPLLQWLPFTFSKRPITLAIYTRTSLTLESHKVIYL